MKEEILIIIKERLTMNNYIYTPGELVTIRTNLKEIEDTLGYPIPGGLVDMSDLKDYILSPGEVATVSENLRRVNKIRSTKSYNAPYEETPLSNAIALIIIGLLALPILSIIEFINWISSIL